MNSLYEISGDLLAVFDKIEQQGGELLPEDEEALVIHQEELKDKLLNYYQYLETLKDNILACKTEEERLKALRKSRENKVELLKKNMLYAVQQFGSVGKSGNNVIELPIVKLSTRRSEVVIEDEKRLKYLYNELKRLINELYANDMLKPNIEWDIQGLCDTLNANIKAEMKNNGDLEYFIPFTPFDLSLIVIDVECGCNIESLFKYNNGIAHVIAAEFSAESKLSVNKTAAKECLKNIDDIQFLSCCHKEVNYSLQIK